ncbi:hypothetical protein GCM10022407_26900 [Hymenobacter antarcticus]|uniref:RHS repeat-associated core domain-containing protein n=1 Tax=Hymenobacter antarcticus TaxID=486270 RepID=A0ABP7QDF9_9BACT
MLSFNEDSVLVDQRTVQLSAAALNNYEPLQTGPLVVQQNGYVSVYVGNESAVDVYFDDVRVEHRQGLQVQENQYDPFGQDLAGVSGAAPGLRLKNFYQFNGKENQLDLGLNWNHQDWRFYDYQIGRWHVVDPEIENAQESWTPYSFGFDNAVRYADADGRWPGPGGVTKEQVSTGVHTALDVVGLVPGLGEVADGLNAVGYLLEGNKTDAALSAAAMIPFAGMAATGAKFLRTADKIATAANHADEAVALAKKGEDLFVGSYSQSSKANRVSGLNKTHTPHHAVQNAVSPSSRGSGPTINLKHDIHAKTATNGKPRRDVSGALKQNSNNTNSLRVHLAADVRELRGLLKEAGYETKTVNAQLTELIRQNKATGNFAK